MKLQKRKAFWLLAIMFILIVLASQVSAAPVVEITEVISPEGGSTQGAVRGTATTPHPQLSIALINVEYPNDIYPVIITGANWGPGTEPDTATWEIELETSSIPRGVYNVRVSAFYAETNDLIVAQTSGGCSPTTCPECTPGSYCNGGGEQEP